MLREPIAVSILTGFLGAGKTTLLNRLLADPALSDTAVIINEFGDVSIDHMLVEQATDGVIELADGCICCTVRGDLVDTLADLVDRVQTGRIERLSRIVVETTGLADPVPVLYSVMAHPALVQALRLDGVICIVDAVNGPSTLDAHAEAVRQVAVADRIVVAKAELTTPEAVMALAARLRVLNPGADMLDAGAGAVALFDCGVYNPATKTHDVRRWLGEAARHDLDHHHHSGHDHSSHDHEGHAHDARVRTVSLVHDHPVPFSTVEMFLDLLRSTQGERLLRMKGVIELSDDPERPLVIHGVQSLLHPPARLPAWPDGPRGLRIVLITFDLPDDHVRRLFSAFMGTPAIDTPDRAALSDNPLAIAGFKA